MDYNGMAMRLAALGNAGLSGPGLARRQQALQAPQAAPHEVFFGGARGGGMMPQQMQAAIRPMYNPVAPMGMPAGVPANAAAFGRKL